jgi:hypothetical protein
LSFIFVLLKSLIVLLLLSSSSSSSSAAAFFTISLFIDLDVDDVFDREMYESYSQWCFEKVLLFKKVLTPLIAEYKQFS